MRPATAATEVPPAGHDGSAVGAGSGMDLFHDDHRVAVAGHDVAITATTGLVHARWSLAVDGVQVDTAAAAGDFTLRTTLADGTAMGAEVHQSLLGPTRVTVVHGDEEVASTKGFVA